MLLESLLGWLIILTALLALSACVVVLPLRCLERKLNLGTMRRAVWLFCLAASSLALWYAIPVTMHYVYFHYLYRRF
jgi:hypothetical protein